MIERIVKRIESSQRDYESMLVFVLLLPLAIWLMIISFLEPLPDQMELIKIDAVIHDLKNKSGKIRYNGIEKELEFSCLCNYGWGYKAFDEQAKVNALVYKGGDNDFYAWDLSINSKIIYTYDELYKKRKEKKEGWFNLSLVGLFFAAIGTSLLIKTRLYRLEQLLKGV